MSKEVKRRNLSGVYIFHKFDDEERREPTCFEDCPEEKQDEWLEGLGPESLKNLAKHLASTLKKIGDKFDIKIE
jgi:hypothetical protein